MKISMYSVKKWASFMLAGMIPLITFITALSMRLGLIIGMIISMAAIVLSTVLCIRLIRHPWLALIEGTGITTLIIDSTGIIGSFIAQMPSPPDINASLGKKKKPSDIYDRGLVHTLLLPRDAKIARAKQVNDQGQICGECLAMVLPFDDFDKLFNFEGKPVFIYNRVLDQFIGKGILSKLETESTLLHMVKHLMSIVKNLSMEIRPFSSYVIEQLKPKQGFLQGKLKWIIIGVLVIMAVVMIGLFGPQILAALKGMGSKVAAGGGHIP